MRWPIGRVPTMVPLELRPNGALALNGLSVTGAGGWLRVVVAANEVVGREIDVRLRVAGEEHDPFLVVEAIRVGRRVYHDIDGFVAVNEEQWIRGLADAVKSALETAIDRATRAHSGVHATAVARAASVEPKARRS